MVGLAFYCRLILITFKSCPSLSEVLLSIHSFQSKSLLKVSKFLTTIRRKLLHKSCTPSIYSLKQQKLRRMERYEKSLTLGDNIRTIPEKKPLPIPHRMPRIRHTMVKKGQRGSNNNLNTIEVSSPIEFRIQFQPEQSWFDKGTPGVGQYDISSPFIKPSYETYQKSDQVILVKINHIGGTSSFRSEGQRFVDGNSIYQPTVSPGPGAYQVASQRNKKHLSTSTYHENYDLIQQLLRSSRQRTQSMPNYKIGVTQNGIQYNGLPKHLQEMYLSVDKQKEPNSIVKPLPLEKLIKLRKRTERLPIVQRRNRQAFASIQKKGYSRQRMTETLYRLDEQLKRQQRKKQKIKAILKPSTQSKPKTIEQQSGHLFRGRVRRQMAFNKNMVNMLFQRSG